MRVVMMRREEEKRKILFMSRVCVCVCVYDCVCVNIFFLCHVSIYMLLFDESSTQYECVLNVLYVYVYYY